MSALSPTGLPLHKFYIGHSGGNVLYFDSITLEASGATPPPPPPGPDPMLSIYEEGMNPPWFDISWGVRNSPKSSNVVFEGGRSLCQSPWALSQ